MIKITIIQISLCLLPFTSYAQDAQQIVAQLFSTAKSIRTLQLTSDSRERLMKGGVHVEKSSFKINTDPLKIYIYQHAPKNGLQCLYVSGANNNKVKINPNSFPWVTLNLDPYNSLMLEERHHSIFDAGFSYTTSLLEYLLSKYQNQKDKLITLKGVQKMNGIDSYHLTFVNPNYKIVSYTTQTGETPVSIAKKLHINFYSILELNPSLSGTSVIEAGVTLKVPNDYASKMEIYIHKDKYYPVFLQVYDWNGLFEEFSFQQVILNPSFKDMDFSEKNPAYKF